jgi:hypothetical protein
MTRLLAGILLAWIVLVDVAAYRWRRFLPLPNWIVWAFIVAGFIIYPLAVLTS